MIGDAPPPDWFSDLLRGTGEAAGLPSSLREALTRATEDIAGEQARVRQAAGREREVAAFDEQLGQVRGRDRLTGMGREYLRDRAAIDYVAGLIAQPQFAGSGMEYVLAGYHRVVATPLANFGKEPFYESGSSRYTVGISLPEVVIGADLSRALEQHGNPLPPTQQAVDGTGDHARTLDSMSTAIEASNLVIRLALLRGEGADAAFDLGAIEFRTIQGEVLRAVAAIEAFKRERDRDVPKRWGRAKPDGSEWLIRAVRAYRDVFDRR